MSDQSEFEFHDEEHGAARRSDPETSREAAKSLETSRIHNIILMSLTRARTGLITHEIAHHTGISWGTITPRMTALRHKGLVYWTGEKRAWYGSPGNPASTRLSMVWQLTAFRPKETTP